MLRNSKFRPLPVSLPRFPPVPFYSRSLPLPIPWSAFFPFLPFPFVFEVNLLHRVEREGENFPTATNCAVVSVDPSLLRHGVYDISRIRSRLTVFPPGLWHWAPRSEFLLRVTYLSRFIANSDLYQCHFPPSPRFRFTLYHYPSLGLPSFHSFPSPLCLRQRNGIKGLYTLL
jgi:hypothetical protein